MKLLINFIISISIFFYLPSYAFEIDPEFMEDEEIDYNSNSSKSSIETKERSEYELEFKNYASARYVSTKITVEYK